MAKEKRPEDDSQSSLEDFFDSSEVDESEEPGRGASKRRYYCIDGESD